MNGVEKTKCILGNCECSQCNRKEAFMISTENETVKVEMCQYNADKMIKIEIIQ